MMNFKNEEAVSSVIGVILMVAITVILAAVIAAFVFGMTGNVQTPKTVSVTASQNGNDIILTYHGGADAATLEYLTVTVTPGETATGFSEAKETFWYDKSKTPKGVVTTEFKRENMETLPVGTTMTLKDCATLKQDHVVVAGHFADGSDHVVLDTYV